MLAIFQKIAKNFSTLLLAFGLSLAVWISAVSAADPTEDQLYPRQVPVELIGQDPGLILTNESNNRISLTLSAPHSIWTQLISDPSLVRAVVDLSGITPGTQELNVQIQIGIEPVRIVSYSPEQVTVTLDSLLNLEFPIHFIVQGEPAVGFQAGQASIDQTTATVSGPASLVKKVHDVQVMVDISQVTENVDRTVALQAVDAENEVVEGVTVNPSSVHLTQEITQRGGYRNVVVKAVLTGQIASGYRLTNISVSPPVITVFSSNPALVEQLPGYIETESLDLTGVKDDLDVKLPLNLPAGISVVGDSTVEVQVGIATIEGSITLDNMPVEISGGMEGYDVIVSPTTVSVILSGPVPVLDALSKSDVHIVIDLAGETVGIYQRVPNAIVDLADVHVDSILPGSVEVTITESLTQTPVSHQATTAPTQLKPSPTPTVTPTP